MMEILPLPAFKDNYIWLLRAEGRAVVVDPGDAGPVLDTLARSGDRLCAILLTHHHADHMGGVAEILACHPVPVYGPAVENIAGVDRPLRGGERVALPAIGAEFDVLEVPGHTRGHIAYYAAGSATLLCGDTLFAAGCGRLFEGTPQQMQASLARLGALPAATQIYCAHEYTASNLRFAQAVEPDNAVIQQRIRDVAARRAVDQPTVPSRMDIEWVTNPFLRWDAPAVRAAATARLGHAPASAVETFAAIREWKNGF